MTQIYVRPAREGLLVPFEGHQGGRYIGMRHSVEGETVAHQVQNGHGYVAALPSLVTLTPYIARRIAQGDLVEVSATEFDALVAKVKADREVAAEPSETEVTVEAEQADVTEGDPT